MSGAAMASPLVDTKLFVPRLRRNAVARTRLSERLGGGTARLTLVSAPAGFGKTTAVVAWLGRPHPDRSVAWLSLDEGDRAPTSFWTYVVTALQSAWPDVGAGVLPLLQSPQAPVEAVLATVLNDLAVLPHDLYLVLDDYHLVDGPEIASGMRFLLDHLPPLVHVVLCTRADPGLPLAGLRASGDLVEVRAADLRFTPEEVARYFTGATDLHLSERDLATLESRTEGWVAALQLAALSMEGRSDVAGFIAGFAGDDRYVVDYLVEEVLARQPRDVRDFLVRTSILRRLTGGLCDAVTGQRDGTAMLERLDRANLFVVPLDDNRRWYRYHHLFADVLQAHLREELPGEPAGLHRQASRWYAAAGQTSPAVRHALAGGDVERAADLIELAQRGLLRDRQEARLRGWLDLLPDDVVRARPVLAIGFVGALMSIGELEDVPRRLRDVERVLGTLAGADEAGRRAAGVVVLDEHELARIPGEVELYWTALALMRGDAPGTHRHARQAVERATPDDHVTRSGATALAGLAFWGSGDLASAHQRYSECVAGLRLAGHISDVLGCSITLADIRVTQGRLSDALATYEEALRLAAREPGVLRGTADMVVGMSLISLERGDVEAATELMRRGQELGEHLGLPQHPYRWRVAMALLREAEGDLAGALRLLEEAQGVYTGDFSPDVRPVSALRARLLASRGDVDEALAWARGHDLAVGDDLAYVHEYEHITLAQVLIEEYATHGAEHALHESADLLGRLGYAAEEGGRTGNLIEVLVLQALAGYLGGDTDGALPALERALSLAEPEGYVRVFTGHGPALAALLQRLASHPRLGAYARRLLAAYASASPLPQPARPGRAAGDQGLVDPLSERELEVLRLLGTDLDGPEMARHLVVSLNTLRTHTKSIYAKLGVHSRRAAVRRGVELGLLTTRRDG